MLCCAAPPGQPPQLFRSEHVEDRVPLAQVQRRCSVALRAPAGGAQQQPRQQAAAAAGSGTDYVCLAQVGVYALGWDGRCWLVVGLQARGAGGARLQYRAHPHTSAFLHFFSSFLPLPPPPSCLS